MTTFPLILAPLFPLFAALVALLPSARSIQPLAVMLAPVPALILAFSGADTAAQDLPSLLMGVRLELDWMRSAFLLLTGLLWAIAAWSAAIYLRLDNQRTRFFVFFLLAMAGNFGLIVAGDVASFYTFFSMMSLASWGLVAHDRSNFARFAGRSYIAFAIAGELALFSGLTIAAYTADSLLLADIRQTELGGIAMLLLAIGFGIKLGVVPLHLWLPLAHAAAPAPASAVLSGAMIKAGLFGALAVLPIGVAPLEQAGLVVIVLGGVSILLATLIGVSQSNPKAVLAYSSVGQMGLVAIALGTGLAVPEAWAATLPALVLFAAHHAFAKAALFLGVPAVWSMRQHAARRVVLMLLVIPAITLAAAPWTSGALAKAGLKKAMEDSSGFWGYALDPVLVASSIATALLMLRFIWLMAREETKAHLSAWLATPWTVMTALAIGGLWLVPFGAAPLSADQLDNAPPILIAFGLALVFYLLKRGTGLEVREVPPGEIMALFQFSEQPAKPSGPLVNIKTQVRWRWPSLYLQWQMPTSQVAGGIALLLILVAIIGAGLVTNPELRSLR